MTDQELDLVTNDGDAPLDRARVRAVTGTGLAAAGEPVFDRIADLVRHLLGVPVGLVSLLDDRRQFFPGQAGLAEPWATTRQTPLSHAICQQVAATRDPLVITDARHDARCDTNPAVAALGIVGYAGMPLTTAEGIVLGALCAIDHEPRTWTPAQLSLLADLALACSDSLRLRIATRRAQHVVAVSDAAHRRARAASQRSELLLHASQLLAQTQTVAEVVAAVSGLRSPAFAPSHIGMVLLDGDQRLRVFGAEPLPADVSARWLSFPASAPLPAADTLRTGQLLLLTDPAAIRAEYPQLADEVAGLGWQAIGCAPVPGVQGRVGALTFSWDDPQDLDADQRSVMVTVAGYVGLALQRVNRLQQQNTAAHTLQQALLTPLPESAGVRLAARYLPAHQGDLVGGDWYDAVCLPDDRLALVIGDVSGHDLTAAAGMSELRSMLRGMLIDRPDSPAAVLERLDHANSALGADTIATVLLAYLQPESDGGWLLAWSNAGHPSPIILAADGHLTVLHGGDPLLGVRHRRPRTTHTHRLPPGASLLLHTDGLVENRETVIDDGFSRLLRLLTGRRDMTAGALADLLVEHADARPREDDVALIIATGAPAEISACGEGSSPAS
ncbi:GAF domain-containing SpoIIE family protein phosphatase [Actinoplanes philippinensis]|uniref:GAF domain-containing SpoIIE family protein phosphatase n=1 Tax=Actinoplanes philippinensis TaxID=35752 RepID=UPI0033CBB9D0